jgi:hypothetical protein
MKMKKLNSLLSFSFLLVVLIGCNDYLDTELEGALTSETFFKTENHAILAINATYQIASFNSTNNNLWVFGDVASDDAVKGGNDGDQIDISFIDDFSTNADNGSIEVIWKHYYEGISRANNVIARVPDIDMNTQLKERIIGEAKFLRAYFYFHLTNIFGEIPLKTKAVLNISDLSVPRSSVNLIYTQIEQDLNEAALVLPDSYSSSELGRATKGAALGMLSKVYLFQKKWDLALNAAIKVEALGYSLSTVYGHNFDVAFENNEESIFEIQHLSDQIPAVGSYLNQFFSPNINGGYFFNAPTDDFVNEFEVTINQVVDPRLDYSVGRTGNKWVDGNIFLPEWSPATGFLGKKHTQPLTATPIGDGNKNYVFMRFAEILLIKAEALNELGRGNEALLPLNKIRKRARESYLFDTNLSGFGNIPPNLLPDITNNGINFLQNAIRHERRVELGLEFHRYYDLMRYGKSYSEDALRDKGFNFDQNRYFPIPQSELDTNKKI